VRILQRLAAGWVRGGTRLYEAIDYTPARLPRGHAHAIVRSLHGASPGMTLLSLAQGASRRPGCRRASRPTRRSRRRRCLLQERIPRARRVLSLPHHTRLGYPHGARPAPTSRCARSAGPTYPAPRLQLLSTRPYHVVVSAAGRRLQPLEGTSPSPLARGCDRGQLGDVLLPPGRRERRVLVRGAPARHAGNRPFEVVFSEARAEFRSRTHQIESYTEIAVSPEDDVELRRPAPDQRRPHAPDHRGDELRGGGAAARGCRGVATRPSATSSSRPTSSPTSAPSCARGVRARATSRLHGCSISWRRTVRPPPSALFVPRPTGCAFSAAADAGPTRARCASPDRSPAPRDSVLSIRSWRFAVDTDSATDESITNRRRFGVAETRVACLGLVGKYQDRRLANRVFALASDARAGRSAAVERQRVGRGNSSANWLDPSSTRTRPLRAGTGHLRQEPARQSGLWGYSVSGDLPIVLLQSAMRRTSNWCANLVQAQLLAAEGLAVDLVIWGQRGSGGLPPGASGSEIVAA